MADDLFAALEEKMQAGGPEAALEQLAEQFRAAEKHHQLFDTRLMQIRQRLGLPLVGGPPIDELPEPLRSETEAAYLDVCREVGEMLLSAGKLRDAWMYLRPTGARDRLATLLETIEPEEEESVDELVELALHEGLAPARGFQLVLDHYGTCNSITTFESVVAQQPLETQVAAAELLVSHLYSELLENVRGHVENRQPGAAADLTLGEIVASHPWIFENESYHIDISHLSSTVRYARLVTNPAVLRKALDLTEYGRRLSKQYQFPDEEPFVDQYPTHGLLFAATLGEQVDEALTFFKTKAEEVDAYHQGTAAIETYLILLTRLKRYDDALEAMARLVPAGAQLSRYAPRLFELAEQSGSYDRYLEICRERDDVLGFAAGLVTGRK